MEEDAGLEVAQLIVTSYIHMDGTSTFTVKTKGDGQMTTYLGLAVAAQHELLKLNDNNSTPDTLE